jgi:hypothetical protein
MLTGPLETRERGKKSVPGGMIARLMPLKELIESGSSLEGPGLLMRLVLFARGGSLPGISWNVRVV